MIEAIVTPLCAPSISITLDCFEEDAPTLGRAGVLLLAAGADANADFGGEAPGVMALALSVVEFLTRSIFLDGFLFGAGFGDRLGAICVLRLVAVFAVGAFFGLAMSVPAFHGSDGAATATARQCNGRERA